MTKGWVFKCKLVKFDFISETPETHGNSYATDCNHDINAIKSSLQCRSNMSIQNYHCITDRRVHSNQLTERRRFFFNLLLFVDKQIKEI